MNDDLKGCIHSTSLHIAEPIDIEAFDGNNGGVIVSFRVCPGVGIDIAVYESARKDTAEKFRKAAAILDAIGCEHDGVERCDKCAQGVPF